MGIFKLKSAFKPKGDQPKAIKTLTEGLKKGFRDQVLLGVTGSGKTFTIANVISKAERPALIIAPNKTLAAQLYNEFCELFPENAVEYFVSYYDYYQPEAYIPSTDTYIEKDASINERIDRLRHSATCSLLSRRDVIVVASVSCLYALGSPSYYRDLALTISKGMEIFMDDFLRNLVGLQYERRDFDFIRGSFRVRGGNVEIIPASYSDDGIRISFFGDEIDEIVSFDVLTGERKNSFESITIYPASHYVAEKNIIETAVKEIGRDLEIRLKELANEKKSVEAKRLESRTRFDMEMLISTGYCKGIENYSRYLDRRKPGERPFVLLDYFPEDFITIIDESHITVPQIGGMYNGDRSRKLTLIEHGFRLPSALDNRPLNFEEFRECTGQTIFVSATPGKFELEHSSKPIAEQIIRPTGLVDPEIIIEDAKNQVKDLYIKIKDETRKGYRVLVTTLTKKLAEELAEYFKDRGVKAAYLHSDIKTIERVKIIRDLRNGKYDVLIGINLLREGLDIPEVSMVAVLDADKEGFLRSETSLIQTSGRAARNAEGKVVFYCLKMTKALKSAIGEMRRRKEKQLEYNKKHGITPKTIIKNMSNILLSIYEKDYVSVEKDDTLMIKEEWRSFEDIEREINSLKAEMKRCAENFDFEKAIDLREKIKMLEEIEKKFG